MRRASLFLAAILITLAAGAGAVTSTGGYPTNANFSLLGVGLQNGGGYGTTWQAQGHANWNVFQSTVPYNPTELQVYSNAAQGIVQVLSGTNQVVRVSGTPFSSSWVGLPYFYYEGAGFKVASVTDSSHLTVQTTAGGAVSWGATANGTFFFATTSTTSTCNVSGTAVTYVAGQLFIPFVDFFYINGTLSPVATVNSSTSITLSSSGGTLTNATCVIYKGIANELTNMRLQALAGSSEEGFVITQSPGGATLQSFYAGSGKYRQIEIGTGEQPAGTLQVMVGMYPSATLGNAGYLTLGGEARGINNQAVAIQPNASNVNYLLEQGGLTGFATSIAARGADTNVGLGLDVQGAGTVNITSHSFGNTELQVQGNGAADFLQLGSNAGSPAITAAGTDSNININLVPKGSGIVKASGLAIATTSTSSFLATYTGFTTTVNGTVLYAVTGNHVCLTLETASGTSNAATMTWAAGSMPTAIRVTNSTAMLLSVEDNTTNQLGELTVFADGSAQFGKGAAGTGGFTTSGTKGIGFNATVCYGLQ